MKLSNDKKGVELTFNTIIVMVLVLLVLVILAFILIKTFGTANATTGCTQNGGECSTTGKCADGKYMKPWGGCADKQVCCSSTLVG